MDLMLDQIVESEIAMRFLDRERLEFTQLRDSIKQTKWIEPIQVRKRQDGKYEILHGLQRYAIACELGLTTIPVQVLDLNDDDAILLAIKANAISVAPKPADYAYQLRRLCVRNPDWTVGYVAAMVCQTPQWVRQQLDLLKLDEKIQKDVDAGRMNLQTAYTMSLCPKTWQLEYREEAMILPTEEFRAKIIPQLREYRQRIRNGKIKQEPNFEPIPFVRPIRVLRSALDKPSIADTMVLQGCESKADAFRLGIAWAISLDPASAQQQRLNAERERAKIERVEAGRRKERLRKANAPELQTPSSLIPVSRGITQ